VFGSGNSRYQVSPANNIGSVSVGSIDSSLNVVEQSGQGPSACQGYGVYPTLVAPGEDIKTADLTFAGNVPNSYATVAGTSFSAPHVTGAMTLLLRPFLDLSVAEMESALKSSALDL